MIPTLRTHRSRRKRSNPPNLGIPEYELHVGLHLESAAQVSPSRVRGLAEPPGDRQIIRDVLRARNMLAHCNVRQQYRATRKFRVPRPELDLRLHGRPDLARTRDTRRQSCSRDLIGCLNASRPVSTPVRHPHVHRIIVTEMQRVIFGPRLKTRANRPQRTGENPPRVFLEHPRIS